MADRFKNKEDLIAFAQSLDNLKIYYHSGVILEAENPKTKMAMCFILDSQTDMNKEAKRLESLNGS